MDSTLYYEDNLDGAYCKEANLPVYVSNIILSGKSAL